MKLVFVQWNTQYPHFLAKLRSIPAQTSHGHKIL